MSLLPCRKLLEGEETRLSTVSSSSSGSLFGVTYHPFSSSPLSGFKGFSGSALAARKEEKGQGSPKASEEPDASEDGESGDEKSQEGQAVAKN